MGKTIFLDRDGTINRESGYINNIAMFEFLPGAVDALRLLKNSGWQLIVITNQAGIARGYFSEDFLFGLHKYMQEQLKIQNAEVDAIYYCPHHPEVGSFPYRKDCNCRKPKTGLIDRALVENEIDIANSFMVGDRYSDIKTGSASNIKTVFIRSGYGRGEWEKDHLIWDTKPDFIYDNILEFAQSIAKM